MKKNHFWQTALFAGALLFGFTACSSDDNGAQQPNENQARTLTIALNLAQPSTMRTVATTDPATAGTTESDINDVIVAIFDNIGNTVKIERVTSSDNAVQVPGAATGTYKWANDGKKITLAAQGLAAGYKVYVVANAPFAGDGSKAGDKLLDCASKSAFEGITISADEALSADGTSTGNGKAGNFVMMGEGVLATGSTTTFVAQKASDNTAAIDLYRLVSKVYIDKASTAFSGIYASAAYEITEIYLDNVPASEKFVLDQNTTAPTLNMNVAGGTKTESSSATIPYLSSGVLATPISLNGTPADIDHYFYTMPNASTTYTRLVVKGNFSVGGGTPTVIYYPIYLNYTWDDTVTPAVWKAVSETALPYATTTRAAKKIYANDAYKITLNIKTIGVTDPRQDLDPQSVEVNVSVANWVDITQNSTFQ